MTSILQDRDLLIKVNNNPDVLRFLLKMPPDDYATFNTCLRWSPSLVSMIAKSRETLLDTLIRSDAGERVLIDGLFDRSRSMISNLAKDAEIIFDFIVRLDERDMHDFLTVFDWSESMLTNLAKYSGSIFEFLVKLDERDRRDFVTVFDWSSSLISNIAKGSSIIFDFVVKLDEKDTRDFMTVYSWSSSLISNLSKHSHDIFNCMVRLDDVELLDFLKILSWSESLISNLAGKARPIFDFLVKLDPVDRSHFRQMFDWPSSLTSNFDRNSGQFLDIMFRCDDQELIQFRSMVNWSDSLIGILANEFCWIFDWIVKLSISEIRSFEQLFSWQPSLLSRLRDEPYHLLPLHRMWNTVSDMDVFIKIYFMVYDHEKFDKTAMMDAWTAGQIESKLWLKNTLLNLDIELGKTWVLCGWIGTLTYLLMQDQSELGIETVRSFDIDQYCAPMADTINRLSVKDGWQFKASTLDVNSISYDNFAYDTIKYDGTAQRVTDTADTIINTSCDHMGLDDSWWTNIPSGRLIILQNNDWHENDQHNNSVNSLNEFKAMYPMQELLYEGELDLTLYTRYMLIGRK